MAQNVLPAPNAIPCPAKPAGAFVTSMTVAAKVVTSETELVNSTTLVPE